MIRLAVLFVVFTLTTRSARAESTTLQMFVGRDLRELSSEELAPLTELLNEKVRHSRLSPFGALPWHVWAPAKLMPKRFLVFEGHQIWSIPGISSARIHVFDAAGKHVKEWSFSTGWRIALRNSSISYFDDLAAYVITIETGPVINGQDVAKQCFAFIGDRLTFLRMEDSKGRMLENNYYLGNKTLGVVPEAKSQKDWLELLSSKDKAIVLSALTFLGGVHPDPSVVGSTAVLNVPPEKLAQMEMVNELRSNKSIGALVRLHARSGSKWIREAARLAEKKLKEQ